ncbi:DUF1801 domain-containing protein [Accumulibacter sp.]|uniref:iron chaperone n=1 Tax=Accumulibacter sp. TaxID=2053492 RepID=UPI00338D7F19
MSTPARLTRHRNRPEVATAAPPLSGSDAPNFSGRKARMRANPVIPEDIDAYIAAFPADIQAVLQAMRATIRQAAPDAMEKISYRIPTFVQHGNLVHFAAFTNHLGFYPGASAIAEFRDELAAYPTSKGTLQLPLSVDIPVALITAMTRFRVGENLARAGSKGRADTPASPCRQDVAVPALSGSGRRPATDAAGDVPGEKSGSRQGGS